MLEKIQSNNLENLSSKKLEAIATLYAQVFAPPPWNEVVKCDTCKQYEGLVIEIGSVCKCGGVFIEAYPLDETVDYIQSEASKPGFTLATIEEADKLIGFAWSWLTTPQELVVKKWQDSRTQQNIIDTLVNGGIKPNDTIRYFSECGVSFENRGLGLANQLTQKVTGPQTTIYRTNFLSPMMAVASSQSFDQFMGPQVIVDRSAKSIIDTGQICNFIDGQNPARVLFIKKATNE